MALSWNEIKDRALRFSKEWENTTNEEADAKPFLDAFFDVFGISRKKIGTFEHRVKKLSDADGYIDLLWKGTILVEMKSRGKNLNKAFQQAIDYTHGLKQNELPKYVLVCDFYYFRLYDTEEQTTVEFTLNDLVQNVQSFGYLLGYQKKTYKEQDPANIKAAELMGKLHDRLEEIGYEGHPLEVYLVRILFCLFAEDTTIFDKQQFQDFIENRTADDGSDLAGKIQELFQVLNTPKEKRFKNLDEQLNDFPYVNGKLFEEVLPSASFDTKMRLALLDCCYIDWSKISPAIFGSMFQSVMNPKERRNLGAHYTSESNILKLIKPLFLDELWTEFESIKGNKNKLPEFHKKISQLKFLDPACGCGNFLVITYRELRLLELEVLRATYKSGQGVLDIREIMWLDVDMMCGIEYEEFPARIAEVAMWLMDHQMNMMISNEFGQYFARLPLKKSAKIVHGNALRLDWNNLKKNTSIDINASVTNIFEVNEPAENYDVLNIYSKKVNINPIHSIQNNQNQNSKCDYIIGNPPFIGKKEQNSVQKSDVELIFKGIKGFGLLDYVACWYVKAAQLIKNTKTKVAFVSTNSISQGEQVNILWNLLFNHYGIKIHFAHQTFSWSNEAKGNAAVHCVIVGFANFDVPIKRLFEYENIKGEAHEIKAKNINPYLVEGKDMFISSRRNPICNVPEINYGSFALDDGNYTLSEDEKESIIKINKDSENLIRPFIGGRELLHSEKRYCLWLLDVDPSDLKKNYLIIERINAVKYWRSNSDRVTTKRLSETPTVFAEIRQPKSNYLAFPTVSSENRKYIPIGFLNPTTIPSNQLYIIPNANLFHFGILTSIMHMAWVKFVCGRLKSDYRYSSSIVYNNYPWPENPSEKQIKNIEEKAQNVLDVRALFPASSLADLYSPLTMPPILVKAHNELDKAVDAAYSKQTFSSEAKRMEFLFELYEKYTAGLFVKEKKATKIKN
ncbi:class I SAM-dependent DNA methyltransferase [Flavobacterium sp. XS2P24]|uniref:DNA methyltransferase n=1 Tax=Flavobacterium sp. XS2P24 TaxID=3041249 RepID=UPI0024A975EF|nr:DNA methyltransferase [Flavobacterium sp. XS2P24]MDI6049616.1 class I SAM-dependent DNA methyltransferase [Flavobacterium sp. XS2P24]